jgi:hypothetical protein
MSEPVRGVVALAALVLLDGFVAFAADDVRVGAVCAPETRDVVVAPCVVLRVGATGRAMCTAPVRVSVTGTLAKAA